MILMSLACAHECMHVQNVRDFLQTKLDSEINSPFLLSLHGNPEQSIKVFEEEKKFDSRT